MAGARPPIARERGAGAGLSSPSGWGLVHTLPMAPKRITQARNRVGLTNAAAGLDASPFFPRGRRKSAVEALCGRWLNEALTAAGLGSAGALAGERDRIHAVAGPAGCVGPAPTALLGAGA